MNRSITPSSPSSRRSEGGSTHTGVRALLAALLVALPVVAVSAGPAQAAPAPSGYIRAGHLVPDLPAMDMDIALSPFSGGAGSADDTPLLIVEATYGTVGKYVPFAPGFYAISLRPSESDPSTPPILETTLQVEAGGSYTVAGVGTAADARLAVFDDDLTMPPDGSSRVRVVNAARTASPSDVAVSTGAQVARGAAYAVPTSYAAVPAGPLTLTASASGAEASRVRGTSDVRLDSGAVYTLLVLESGPTALRVLPVLDSAGTQGAPVGGAATGFGGAAAGEAGGPMWLLAVAGVAGAVALAGAWSLRRVGTA